MKKFALLAAALATLVPLVTAAQEAAPPMPEDPRAPRYREVERGLFTGFEVGYLSLFKTPTADRTKFPFAGADGGRASGVMVGATLGVDLTDRLALAAYLLGGNASSSVDYGAFSVFSAGGDLRASLFGARDGQGVQRLFVYLHARGGFLLSRPEGLFQTGGDLYLAGGPGLEYFTHLRHFSVGLAADVAYVSKAKTAGLVLSPTVRYTF